MKDQERIDNSTKLIDSIESIVQEFNRDHSKKVRIETVKNVFVNASKEKGAKNSELSLMEYCMAKVGAYFKLASGNLSGFKVSFSNRTAKGSSLLSDEDVEFAKANIEKFALNFKFDSIDDLYIVTRPLTIVENYL